MTLKEKFENVEFSFPANESVKIADDLAIDFANWIEKLPPNRKVSVWSKNGEHKGLFSMDNEQLLRIFKDEKGL